MMEDYLKPKSFAALAALASLGLSGCGFGLRTPELQEIWDLPKDGDLMVREISKTVYLSVEKAVWCVVEESKHDPQPGMDAFESTWGVQITLSLSIQETTSLNPGVTFNTPLHAGVTNFSGEFLSASTSPLAALTYPLVATPQSYALGLGGKVSSQATRVETAGAFFTVARLLKNAKENHREDVYRGHCDDQAFDEEQRDALSRDASKDRPSARAQFLSLIVNNDLKIYEWLQTSLSIEKIVAKMGGGTTSTGNDKSKSKGIGQNAITHEVTFLVLTDGNVTPTWKLVRVSANSNSPFFDMQRQRTHDLIVTFGPKDDTGNSLADAARSTHNAALYGLSNANAFRQVLSQ